MQPSSEWAMMWQCMTVKPVPASISSQSTAEHKGHTASSCGPAPAISANTGLLDHGLQPGASSGGGPEGTSTTCCSMPGTCEGHQRQLAPRGCTVLGDKQQGEAVPVLARGPGIQRTLAELATSGVSSVSSQSPTCQDPLSLAP